MSAGDADKASGLFLCLFMCVLHFHYVAFVAFSNVTQTGNAATDAQILILSLNLCIAIMYINECKFKKSTTEER